MEGPCPPPQKEIIRAQLGWKPKWNIPTVFGPSSLQEAQWSSLGAPDSPQAEVGDSRSALGTSSGPGWVPSTGTRAGTAWEGLEPGASPGLRWAILERKAAGTSGTVLRCGEKAEGSGRSGDQRPVHAGDQTFPFARLVPGH